MRMRIQSSFTLKALVVAVSVTTLPAVSHHVLAGTETKTINQTAASIAAAKLTPISREYVRLTLAMGAHDSNYVDAYYGPEQWQAEVKRQPMSLLEVEKRAKKLHTALKAVTISSVQSMDQLRLEFLRKQTRAMLGRIDVLQGKKLSFDQESAVLYDTVAPHFARSHFEEVIKKIDALLPGNGSTVDRVNTFRAQFVIPKDKMPIVFEKAIAACREQTSKHIKLPEGENFRLEFVTGKPWSGYNWYKGNYQSVIQINTELPTYIERALDIGCHEGYPGHHAYNVLLEKNLVKDRQWMEFSVYPLFSPQSLIAEGSANYGIEMAFPEELRKTFQRDVLYPLAGINPALFEKYDALLNLTSQLSYAGNEAARDYLDGKISREQAIEQLITYELYPKEKALQRTTFFDAYRSYVINYNYGKDLVKKYVKDQVKGDMPVSERHTQEWKTFEQLLSSPRLPSGLKTSTK